ncbi:OLC1v1013261C1 [Oldenlandia corymbosa var. corymbosa]|uniref:OLC1v1013261C1 n=1 Tax=Oldenlandia corymbosa var. corymbosa TaxID=529605 RepID=A0AAV1E187_OLDCO|nr:OLC1v1013261C1 [Oldenlandia corymbosa var. corymbosa]
MASFPTAPSYYGVTSARLDFSLPPSASMKMYLSRSTIQFRNEDESRAVHYAFEPWKKDVISEGSYLPNGTVTSSKSKFDSKIEASSAKMYFYYYGQILHQQNMLQDYVRTGTYYASTNENRADFIGLSSC